MARAHFVKKALKDNPAVKKGESYYWWAFMVGGRGGPKHYSKTQPRGSQLTQSAYLGAISDIQDQITALTNDDGLGDGVSEIVTALNELADEQEEKLSNMPDGLQSAPSGEMLQERADACRAAADELDGMSFDVSDKDAGETDEEYWNGKLDEVQSVSIES